MMMMSMTKKNYYGALSIATLFQKINEEEEEEDDSRKSLTHSLTQPTGGLANKYRTTC